MKIKKLFEEDETYDATKTEKGQLLTRQFDDSKKLQSHIENQISSGKYPDEQLERDLRRLIYLWAKNQ